MRKRTLADHLLVACIVLSSRSGPCISMGKRITLLNRFVGRLDGLFLTDTLKTFPELDKRFRWQSNSGQRSIFMGAVLLRYGLASRTVASSSVLTHHAP